MRGLVSRERLLDCKVPERLTSTIMSPAFDWTVMAVRSAQTFAASINTLLVYAGPSGTVYMTGAALRVGAFELGERDSFGLTELVAIAGGLRNDAALDKIKILRPILDGTRHAEIKIDGKAILEGRATDFRILPFDTVVVPVTREKAVIAKRALMMTVPIVVSSLIYVAIRQ